MGDNNSSKWDILGLASIGITIFGASMFYVAGWAYLSHWYGYFGLDLNTLSLPTHICMVHGFFGIFVTLFVWLFVMCLFSFIVTVLSHKSLYQSVVFTFAIAPLASGVLILLIIWGLNQLEPRVPVTKEAIFLLFLFAVCSIFSLIVYISGDDTNQPGERTLYSSLQIVFVATFFILSSVVVSATLGEYEARSGKSLFPEIREPLPITVVANTALYGLESVVYSKEVSEEVSEEVFGEVAVEASEEIIEEVFEGVAVEASEAKECIYRYKGLLLLATTGDSYYFLLERDGRTEFVVHGVPKKNVCQLIIDPNGERDDEPR